jgi:hypothetical protein
MIRKFTLATLFILQLSILPSWGEDRVLIDRVTTAEAEQLDIEIPAEVTPGYHEVEIQVSDDAGVVETRILTFCKDLDGRIDWEGNCPNLATVVDETELTAITDREDLPTYDPAQDVEKSKDLQVTAFAALAVLSGGVAAAGSSGGSSSGGSSGQAGRREDDNGSDSGDSQDQLESVEAGHLHQIDRGPGVGDMSSTWRTPSTGKVDALFAGLVTRVSAYSPLTARTLADGGYLRAMFGSRALITLIPSLLLGLLALHDTAGQALPPATWIVMGIIACATLDAASGFVAGVIFAVGVLLSGNLASRGEILTVAGLFIIFFAPALLASAIRPLRRLAEDRDEMWERATDYGLATLLSGWTMVKMVGALNGLSGLQLPITFKASEIALWAAIFVLIRLLLEDLATYAYPERLKTIHVDFIEPLTVHKVIALELRVFIFVELAMPFVGYNAKLLLGTIIFILPSIIDLVVGDRLPKTSLLYRILPRGAFKIVAMVFIGTFTAAWIQGLFDSPRTFLAWSFVVLAIPGLILGLLDNMADEPSRDWKKHPFGNTLYRVLGVVVFLLIIQIVRGVDLYALVFNK